ncbi:MAG: M28 family peptidase [Colwellia sp.]|nr:M28 family peptidase [Colwellia sp.]
MVIKNVNVLIVLIGLLSSPISWGAAKLLPSSAMKHEDSLMILEHIRILSSDKFSGRKFASQGSLHSQSYLVATLENLDIAAFNHQYRHSFEQWGFFKSKQGTNIIAYIPGTHHVDEYIVLSAHYDHIGSKGNKVYNGADDNASGTAALLHYAKRLSHTPLKHSVILLFTDGEEVNLLGAKAFITEHKNLLSKFKLNINLDMIAGSKRTKRLRFISKDLDKVLTSENLSDFSKLQMHFKTHSKAQLTAGFKRINRLGGRFNRTNWRMASDHGIFSKAGIPFIYFGVGTHKNYHSELDDYENINQDLFLSATEVIFKQLSYLDHAMSARTIAGRLNFENVIVDEVTFDVVLDQRVITEPKHNISERMKNITANH